MTLSRGGGSDDPIPALELPARIGWHPRYTGIVFDDPPYLVLQATPVFPCSGTRLAEQGIVWDVLELWASVAKPGGYYVLNSDCGYAPDSGIEVPILVSHPDEHTVVWELDVKGLQPALEEGCLDTDGFVRLVFARHEYEADIRELLRDLLGRATRAIAPADLSGVSGLDLVVNEYPHLQGLRVEELEPNTDGLSLDRLLDIDPDASCLRQPIWPCGTLLEFGFFDRGDGHELMAVDGEPRRRCWPTWYFTRWQALAAFRNWLALVQRRWALPQEFLRPSDDVKNKFALRQESDRALCHASGRRLAQVLQQCYDEGNTAPGVTVRYRECALPVALVAGGAVPSADDALATEGHQP